MIKSELGSKLICQNCGARFYDLNKRPAVCPKCATEYVATVKKSASGTRKPKANLNKNLVETEGAESAILDVDDIDVLESDVDEDEDLMEDTSDLGEGDDEMQEVKDRANLDDMEK